MVGRCLNDAADEAHIHTQLMLHKSKQGKDYVIYGRFKAISL